MVVVVVIIIVVVIGLEARRHHGHLGLSGYKIKTWLKHGKGKETYRARKKGLTKGGQNRKDERGGD